MRALAIAAALILALGTTVEAGESKHSSTAKSSSNAKSTSKATGGTTSTSTSVNVEDEKQIAPAYAPGLVAAPETCMGSVAGGGSFLPFGLSFGTTYKSSDCELRMFARSLQLMGQHQAALFLLAKNEDVARALLQAGYKLPEALYPQPKVVLGDGQAEVVKADGQ